MSGVFGTLIRNKHNLVADGQTASVVFSKNLKMERNSASQLFSPLVGGDGGRILKENTVLGCGVASG